MQMIKICLLALLVATSVAGQLPTPLVVSVCDVVKNPKKYHKKVIYLNAVLDAHVESWVLKPERGCSAHENIVFDTDEDFDELNYPAVKNEFEAALNPRQFLSAERLRHQFGFVLRTELTVKGYFIASDERRPDSFDASRYLISIRQIQDIGQPRLIEINSKEYWDIKP